VVWLDSQRFAALERSECMLVDPQLLNKLCDCAQFVSKPSAHTGEMKNILRFIFISTLLLGTFGCAAESSEKAAEARVDAADASARAIAGGKKGAAIGAVTGGGAGTGVVLATKGKEIHLWC